MQIKIRVLKYNELSEALKLIESTFMLFVAPDYMDQGVQSFLGFISDEKNIRAMIFFGAFEDGELKGVMAVNADRSHICCLFVDGRNQNRGIARALFNFLLKNSDNNCYTVNSSPYAIDFYRVLGFAPTAPQQVSDGIKFTPMKFLRQK